MNRSTLVAAAAILVASAAVTAGVKFLRRDTDPPLVDVPTGLGPPSATAPRGAPNVVLVIGCDVRQSEVAPYFGYAEVTPYLSQLATQGSWFTDPITPAPWTRPSVAGIVSGMVPRAIGMEEPGPGKNLRILAPPVATLAERLRDGGWHTLGLSGSPNVSHLFGFDQGFEQWVELGGGADPADPLPDGAQSVARALDLVDKAGSGPFYLQVLLTDAHFPPDAVAPQQAYAFHKLDNADDDLSHYRVGLNRLDRAVYALDRGLHDRGHDERDTLFVFVNDHGEGLHVPDWHGHGHGRFLFGSSVGGVWMVRGPGIPADHRIRGVSSLLDVAPTVLSLLGLAPLAAPDGVDQSAQVRGASDHSARDVAFAETTYGKSDRAALYTDLLQCQRDFEMVRSDQEGTQLRSRFVQGCCYRQTDRDCKNIRPDGPRELQVADWRASMEQRASAWTGTADAPVTAEEQALLDAFGYLEREKDKGRE
jgi:arylsulfatase A-like enzyme